MIRCDYPNCGCKKTTTFKWISHVLKTIYFEVPKVASTSIRKGCFGIDVNDLKKNNPYDFEVFRDSNLEKYSDYFKFTIVRNPWDRIVSIWKMYTTQSSRKKQIKKLFKIEDPANLSFLEFIEKMTEKRNHHWEQQIEFLPNLNELDYIGRFENLREAWHFISYKLGINTKLQKLNVTDHYHYHYSEYYDRITKGIVEKEYAKDFKILKFKFEVLSYCDNFSKEKSNIAGLKYIPTQEPYRSNGCQMMNIPSWLVRRKEMRKDSFSVRNRKILFKRITPEMKCILEIGVNRYAEKSSTSIVFKGKSDDCVYLGIDLMDKSYLDNPEKNIYTMKCNSNLKQKVIDKLNSLGQEQINLLIIDGDHSINGVIGDWGFTKWLAEDGIVFLHDTNAHTGPMLVYDAIDETMYKKKKRCTGRNEDGSFKDWGIGVCRKIKE